MYKIECLGIKGKVLDIIRDFLTGRSFRVCVGGEFSNLKDVLSGIPQGSVLGPLLFVLYINDLPDSIKSFAKLFADDLKMIHKHGNWSIILRIKGVQRRFIQMINGIGLLPYSERLEMRGLTTLPERCARGDLIEVYKAKHDFSFTNNVYKFGRAGLNLLSKFCPSFNAKCNTIKRNCLNERV